MHAAKCCVGELAPRLALGAEECLDHVGRPTLCLTTSDAGNRGQPRL
ncbi:hypothetical protein [Streptomyces venezuelae]|nr:hypothetical protein [Streptomyces venezuelae]